MLNATALVGDERQEAESWARVYQSFKWVGTVLVPAGAEHVDICFQFRRGNDSAEDCLPKFPFARSRIACRRSATEEKRPKRPTSKRTLSTVKCGKIREELREVCVVLVPSTKIWSLDPSLRSCAQRTNPLYEMDKSTGSVRLVVRSAGM